MKTWRPTSRLRRAVTVAAVACLATTAAAALTATPAFATGTLTNVTLTVSNTAANAPQASSAPLNTLNLATYTWAFTTDSTTSVTLDHVTLTLPYTTTLSTAPTALPALMVYGLASSNCSPAIPTTSPLAAGTAQDPGPDLPATLTVNLGCSAATAVNTPVVISVSNIVNPTKPVASFASVVKTYDSTSVNLGSGAVSASSPDNTVSFVDNTTPVTVFVPSSLTFTNSGASSISLAPIPGGPVVSAPVVSLGVTTNEPGGYTLSACVQGGIVNESDNGASIPQAAPVTTSLNVTTGSTAFGAVAANHTGSSATVATAFASPGTYAGYSTDCTSPSEVASNTIPTSTDAVDITNAASASDTQEAGTYKGTITYVVTPSY